MPYAPLPDRSLLALSGDDTLPFLQGLVSNDVLRLRERGIVYAALLTPQGKFLHDFFVLSHDGKVLIDCEKSRSEELMQRLMKYRLRSKVTIELLPESFGITTIWNESEANISGFRDPRVPELGWRLVGNNKQVHPMTIGSADDYDLHRLNLGVPVGGRDLIPEKSFLLPFGFENLHGVDFNKGCYVGQEVTARSKHRGQIRKSVYKITSSEGNLPPTGTPVYCGETLAGELGSVRASIGLALLNVEAVTTAKALRCGSIAIRAQLPDWIKSL